MLWVVSSIVSKSRMTAVVLNCPDYMAIWLGITRVGGIVALLNTNLVGPHLTHAINLVNPKHIIVGAEIADDQTNNIAGIETLIEGPPSISIAPLGQPAIRKGFSLADQGEPLAKLDRKVIDQGRQRD